MRPMGPGTCAAVTRRLVCGGLDGRRPPSWTVCPPLRPALSLDAPPLPTPGAVPEAWRRECLATPRTGSFVHLHLGIDAAGLPPGLECHHLVVNDWDDTEVGAAGWVLLEVLKCEAKAAARRPAAWPARGRPRCRLAPPAVA